MAEPADDCPTQDEGAELAETTFEIRLTEVEDVLGHREPDADQRAVDETIERAVDLVPGKDEYRENRDPLERLFDQWRTDHDRGRRGDLGAECLFDCKLEEQPGNNAEQDRADRAPGEAGEHGT